MGLNPKNIGRHISRVHPEYHCEMPKVSVSSKCIICGRFNDPARTKYGLSICNGHYVSDVRRFLVKEFYLKLKDKNNCQMTGSPEVAGWAVNFVLNEIYSLLTWMPEEIPQFQFMLFSEMSSFAGYLLLRSLEMFPNLGEILQSISLRKMKEPTSKKMKMKINKFLIDLKIEYELFLSIKFAASGYFDIAVDTEEKPSLILIVPKYDKEAVDHILQLRLKDANAEWHGTFRKIVVPYGISTAYDSFGSTFRFKRATIKEHFQEFRKAWQKVFGRSIEMEPEDFEALWNWLKWVVSPEGFTERNTDNALWFNEYEKLGLKRDMVFEVFNQILPDLNSKQYVISTKNLTKKDPALLIVNELARISRAFKLPCSDGWIYFVNCREWFYNTIVPVFVEFARSLNLAGPSFEENVATMSSFYSKVGLQAKNLSSFGMMIEPKLSDQENHELIKTSRNLPWKILGTNIPITLPLDNVTRKIGSSGEIDIIIYANMNIYLVELKALNLGSKEALEYCRKEAPKQCAKYAYWVRKSSKFKKLLQNNGVADKDFKSVRILICSSGGFPELFARCQETDEIFAIVPEFILFSVMAGFFTLSLKEPFPSRVNTMVTGLKLATLDTRPKILRLDTDVLLREKMTTRLAEWVELITFDRRTLFTEFKFDAETAKASSFFGVNYIMNEVYIGRTTNWILERPLFIGEAQGYKFHIGTQIGNVGVTHICKNCKSVIRYYYPKLGEDERRIQEILKKATCPFCGQKVNTPNEYTQDVLTHMLMFVTKLKRNIQTQ
ncbi:MAG: hypothetical protein ACTSV7_11630 [Candidatus Baldrarchaeia archaeon]